MIAKVPTVIDDDDCLVRNTARLRNVKSYTVLMNFSIIGIVNVDDILQKQSIKNNEFFINIPRFNDEKILSFCILVTF